MWLRIPVSAAVLSGLLAQAGPATPTRTPATDPGRAEFAVAVTQTGVPNLYKVSEGLFRGGQPTAEGFRALQKLGVQTVVNLRPYHSDEDAVRRAGMGYRHIGEAAWRPTPKETVAFLELVTDAERGPVFVHDRHGTDRSVVLCAVYRVVVQNWSKPLAIREMTEGGSGFQGVWRDLIQYVEDLDVDDLRRRAGIES